MRIYKIAQDQQAIRKQKIVRIKELKEKATPFASKGNLTREEAKAFKDITTEINSLRYDVATLPTIDKILPPQQRQSTMPSEMILDARKDLMTNKDVYMAITEAATGVSFNAYTPIDDVMAGKNPAITPKQFYDAFSTTREKMR